MDGDQLLRANASWKLHLRNRVGEVSLAGLSRTRIPYHFIPAIGRRLRRTYAYVLTIQALAYLGRSLLPTPVTSFGEFVQRAAIGPIPGEAILAAGVVFNGVWIIFAFVTYYSDPEIESLIADDPCKAGRGRWRSKARKPFGPSTWFRMGSSRMRRKKKPGHRRAG